MAATPFTGGERPAADTLASVNKALDVLEAFGYEQPAMGLGELAIKVGLGKSTVHKLLRTLVDRGYVRQDPATKHYALTLRSWQVGMVALSTVNVREVALPHLRRLSALTGEQSTLWLYDDGQVVCVQRVETRHRVRSYTRVGAVEPALDLAAGRCLLAHQPAAEVRRVAERLPDPGAVGALEAQLRRIRTQGYDLNTGERWTDVRAIAAPIRDHAGEVVAGLSVSGPDGRFDEDSVSAMLPHVVSVAAEISAELGHPAAERAERSGRG